MAFIDNLSRLRGERGLTQEELAELVGVQQETVSRWETGEREPRGKTRRDLAAALRVTEAELFVNAADDLPEGALPVRPIPMLGEVPAGPWREAVHKSRHHIPAPEAGMPKSAYALKVTGNSMDRVVKDGATIIIDPEDRDLFDKWFYVVRNDDHEVTFKQYRENPARLVPCSTDPSHTTISVSDRGYEVLGRVISIVMRPDQAALD